MTTATAAAATPENRYIIREGIEKNGNGNGFVAERPEIAIKVMWALRSPVSPRTFLSDHSPHGSRHQDPVNEIGSGSLRNSMFRWLGGRRGRVRA